MKTSNCLKDVRYKHNIQPMKSHLKKILQCLYAYKKQSLIPFDVRSEPLTSKRIMYNRHHF